MSAFYPLKVASIRRETDQCVSLTFDIPATLSDTFAYKPGQYLTLKTDIDGTEVRRSYSVCSSPNEGVLRIAVKEVEGGRFSTYANRQLRVGDLLDVMPPMGRFSAHLDPNQSKKYVFFAVGSGITPILSNIKAILHTEPQSHITLVYGNQSAQSVIFREEIEGLKNKNMSRMRLIHILSREKMDTDLFFGRLNSEKLLDLVAAAPDLLKADDYFICGPEDMTFALKETLSQAGIAAQNIHFELFGTQTAAKPRAAKSSHQQTVTIKLDGILQSVPNAPNETILDAALAAGADLPYACKGGVCATCRAKCVQGQVDMVLNYALEHDEIERGYILTCQAYPVSGDILIDFDAK